MTTYVPWNVQTWEDLLLDQTGDKLLYWPPGEPLPEYQFTNHLAGPCKRALQRVIHAALLPVLDRLRSPYPETYSPTPLPDPSKLARDPFPFHKPHAT